MANNQTQKNREKYSIQIILVGLPKVVMHVINFFHGMHLAKAGDWLEVQRNKATGKVTMTITLHFML